PAAGPAWAGFRPLRVSKVVPESATVSSIYLTAPDESPLPGARPGQYLTLRVTAAAHAAARAGRCSAGPPRAPPPPRVPLPPLPGCPAPGPSGRGPRGAPRGGGSR